MLLPAGSCLLCAAHLLCHKVGRIDVWLNLLHKRLEALQAASSTRPARVGSSYAMGTDPKGNTPRAARMQVQSQPQTHTCFHLECLHMLGNGGVAAPAEVTVAQQSAAQHNPAPVSLW